MVTIDVFMDLERGEHVLYKNGIEGNTTFYSGVVTRVAKEPKPRHFHLVPTDNRLTTQTRELPWEEARFFRIPETVLLGQMQPDEVRALLTEQAPGVFPGTPEVREPMVNAVMAQLENLVATYQPLEPVK